MVPPNSGGEGVRENKKNDCEDSLPKEECEEEIRITEDSGRGVRRKKQRDEG